MTFTTHATLATGDIVAFRFPSTEGEQLREKERPCLILDTDGVSIVVAYGTSSRGRSNRGQDLMINFPKDWSSAGLRRATRFVGARRVRVPVDSARLVPNSAGTPRIGRLPEGLQPRLEGIRARLLDRDGVAEKPAP